MQKWEYKVTDILSENELNEIGLQGWELVAIFAVSSYGASSSLVFKRPISN